MSSLDYKEDARDLHAFKELRFFLSHSVPLEIRCGVARLELPLVADYLLGGDGGIAGGDADYGNNKQQPRQQQQKTRGQQKQHGLVPEVAAGTADDGEEIARIVRRIVAEPELVATCQLFSDGQPMHKVAMSSHTPSRYDPRQHAIVWDDSMCFPVRYRDLDRNSQLVVVLRGAKDRLVGVASMRFFDANGSLNMGLQKRPFLFTDRAPFSWDPAAPPSGREPGQDGVWCGSGGGDDGGDGGRDGILSKGDWGFALERMREKYRLRAMDRADWLDPASLSRVDRLVAALADPDELRKHRAYQTDAEASLRDSPKLGGRAWGASDLLAGGGSDAFLLVSDYEMEEDNPVEHKYRKLAHDQLRGLVDPELKPNRDERHRIDDLVAGRQDHLSMEDKDLLWKFRYCLTDNKRALTKLLLSVDWGVDSEVAQVENLLAEWARRAPIDAPDALKLLGRERTFQAEVVRRFAVDALRRASDDELLAFLLQLFLIERACKSLKLANFFFWYLRVELEDASHGHIFRSVQAAFQRSMGRTPESARVL
ncbi:unnamed protein product, partial [Ectocarpus sp. 4 AP-2014]